MNPDSPDTTTKFHSPDPSTAGSAAESDMGSGSEGAADFAAPPDLSFLAPPAEPGDLGQLSTYRIRRMLGYGGMGLVFEAIDTQLRRLVALKVMRPELATSLAARTRFLKEARAAAALSSDHIVTVFQVGQDNDVPYMAMQLLRGEALDSRLAREPRLPVLEALTIAIQAATGLAAAHEAGLVHRDVKPANLWLEVKDEAAKKSAESGRMIAGNTGPDTSFRVKILDLGLVRGGGGPRLTTAGVVVGTPHFMAPEQAGGAEIDHRADLFSLGCVIYTMLTGELAFPGKSTMAVLMTLANHTPPLIHERNDAVPPELSELVAKLLAKKPEDRPASALEVIDLLGMVLNSEMERQPQPAAPARRSGSVEWKDAMRRPLPELKSRSGMPIMPDPPAVHATPRDGTSSPTTSVTTPTPSLPSTPSPGHTTTIGPVTPVPPTPVPIPVPPTPIPRDPTPAPDAHPHPAGHSKQVLSVGVGLVAIAISLVVLALVGGIWKRTRPNLTPVPESTEVVKVGILHSESGSMAMSESPVIDATQLAIDEVNQAGGVLGRKLQAVGVDGKSDPDVFAAGADKLLNEEKVPVVFGCWTSASRKAVRPAFERTRGLLFYPVHYEGLEQSPRIVYTGTAPNQQILPAIEYLTGKLGKKRLFVVGSDYVYPRAAYEIIKDQVTRMQGIEMVGSDFIPLGSKVVEPTIVRIQKAKPDAIVNTLNSTTNFAFFEALHKAGITPENTAILSTSVAENELRAIDTTAMAGSYIAASYFQSVDREESRAFVQKIRARYGQDRVVSDAMAAAYTGVHMWAKAANAAGKFDPESVLAKIRGMTFAAPGGLVKIDPENLHTWQPWRIGKVRADGQIDIIAAASESIAPIPFPNTRSRPEWERFLGALSAKWDNRWQAPSNP